ncbi:MULTISPECIES: acyclic terpene utilization AtuA family protein [Hydrogenophaga]|uniref:Acyclic terpene utilization AtuA family protein n=2 Tax=Hydrogenophaga TaxID=47420 RepID=A0ABW2QTX2_9BURK
MTSTRLNRPLRIGCASGFWGDSEAGAAQLVRGGQIDYLVFDYLAEITMSLLARARAKSPEAGYAPDFVKVVAQLAPELLAQNIRVVANAGGVNPQACASALAAALQAQGLAMRIAVVEGDDLSAQADTLRAEDTREMFSGDPMPAKLLSVNAYLGAQPIAAALDAGAQVVITGRVVDSAVTLAPLVHVFGWAWDDWDKLATGCLAGHLIECGTQCTGGLFTDWQRVPGWDHMGFPIAECDPDGASVVITKPPGTGGLVEPATVAEQIVYEIADPRRYLLPDVTCDFSQVQLVQEGPERVRVSGARGTPAPVSYKVSATFGDGWRLLGTLMIGGHAAAAKAQRVGEAILQRCTRLLTDKGLGGFTETSLEVLGAEATYGPHARTGHAREVVLKLAAKHPQREALELLAREIAPSATSMAQGITGFAAGRPSPSPVVRLFSFLIDRSRVAQRVALDGQPLAFEPHVFAATPDRQVEVGGTNVAPAPAGPTTRVPLLRLAHGRSGDKGDSANIGVIARSAAAYAELRRVLSAEVVQRYFAHLAQGPVRRYELPGFGALNFVLERALGGGGVASLRYDPQGKAFAQMLLDLEVDVATSVLDTLP